MFQNIASTPKQIREVQPYKIGGCTSLSKKFILNCLLFPIKEQNE